MEDLPSTLQGLAVLEEEAQRAADQIHDNPQVIQLYKKRKREIEKEEAELAELTSALHQALGEIGPAKDIWETRVRNLAEEMNQLFSEYMQGLGNEGAVCVQEHETDYSKWGLEIKVGTFPCLSYSFVPLFLFLRVAPVDACASFPPSASQRMLLGRSSPLPLLRARVRPSRYLT